MIDTYYLLYQITKLSQSFDEIRLQQLRLIKYIHSGLD